MLQGSNVSWDKLNLFGVTGTTVTSAKQRSKRRPVDKPLVVDVSNNKELAKLQLYGSRFCLFRCRCQFLLFIEY